MNQTRTSKQTISAQERWLSLFLVALLVLIAGVVLALQYRFDVGKWREQSETAAMVAVEGGGQAEVAGLKPLSAPEIYDAITLSDKINGKAELYLAAGFTQLESRRFGFTSDPGRWMERYVYKMEGHPSAFAVYSAQRRSDVTLVGISKEGHAYLAANGLFMVHGPFYVEIIAAEDSDAMRDRTLDLARAFIAGHKVSDTPLEGLALFPNKGLVANSRTLVAADAFGMAGLDWVFTGRYAENGQEVTAFVSPLTSANEAEALAGKFLDYWRDYGGEAVVLPKAWTDYGVITILDNYEMVRVEGRYLIGVHEAADLEFGLGILQRLRQSVREVRHES